MPMLGHLEILTECVASGQTGTDVSEMAHYALNSGQKIFALLENLLQWAKAQMGGIECNPTVLDLHEEAARVLDLISPVAKAKEISLSIQDTTDGQRKVYADRNLLDVVLRNLLSNAIKFTRRGGQVTISATRRGTKFIEVAISDTGVGIKATDKAKLLQSGPHFTTIGTGGERGSGLGLALCKEMVERNGGRLSIDSAVEQGTTVRFTVPIASTVNKPVHSRSSRHTSRVAERQACMLP